MHSGTQSAHDLPARRGHARPLCAVRGRVLARALGARRRRRFAHVLCRVRTGELPVQLPPGVPDMLLVRVRSVRVQFVHVWLVRLVRLLVRQHVPLLPRRELRLFVQLRGTLFIFDRRGIADFQRAA